MSELEQTCVMIVQEIAAVEGTDPMELEPLQDVIDTDALDAVVRNSDARSLTVEFNYRGHTVRVEGPDQVEVLPERQSAGCSAEICCD